MDIVVAVLVIAFGGLVVALFVLAMAEVSLLHVRRSEVVVRAEPADGSVDPQARRLLALVDDLPRVMNAVLLAVLFGQVAATSIAGVLAQRWFGSSGITVATIVVTVLLFVYGEAIPKTLGLRNPYRVASRLAFPVRGVSAGLRPVVSVLVAIADRQSPADSIDTVTAVSEAELRHLADEAAEAGRIEETDAELIERSFVLGDLVVEQIMVPVGRVRAIRSAASVDEALRTAIAAGHRRLPVHERDLAHIVGFVRLRDLAEHAAGGDAGAPGERDPGSDTIADAAARGLVRPCTFVEPTMPVIDLLRSMQRSGRHLAVVVDGAGESVGIATIEDAVRELVGAIEDGPEAGSTVAPVGSPDGRGP